MQTHSAELVRAARAVARLQASRRRLRRDLKRVELELRHEKKLLRGLIADVDNRRSDVVPLRTFGDAVGLVAGNVEPDPRD